MTIIENAFGIFLGICMFAVLFLLIERCATAYRKAQRTRQPFWRVLVGA